MLVLDWSLTHRVQPHVSRLPLCEKPILESLQRQSCWTPSRVAASCTHRVWIQPADGQSRIVSISSTTELCHASRPAAARRVHSCL